MGINWFNADLRNMRIRLNTLQLSNAKLNQVAEENSLINGNNT